MSKSPSGYLTPWSLCLPPDQGVVLHPDVIEFLTTLEKEINGGVE
jgi:hypothetical protein